MLCPHCNAFQDAITHDKAVFLGFNNLQLGVANYKCTHCEKYYLVIYEIDKSNQIARCGTVYPSDYSAYTNEILESISPRFIDSYNQALRCELRGDIELAAVGYRQSLECLVKDYAINELSVSKEIVIKKSLFNAIEEYLGERDLIATADVVRILGNDYAHYDRKYPDHDFTLLKQYMTIFIKLVETKLMIAHPPVSR